ncbi:MAG: cupredoxin domain-containing protein, partial [Dehalococcoidia bacterium]
QMTENPYLFVPDHLELEAGKTYRFNLRAGAEFHTFTIESLGINVNVLPGQDATVEVTVDTPGEHELICLPHQTQGMVGEVHVE